MYLLLFFAVFNLWAGRVFVRAVQAPGRDDQRHISDVCHHQARLPARLQLWESGRWQVRLYRPRARRWKAKAVVGRI